VGLLGRKNNDTSPKLPNVDSLTSPDQVGHSQDPGQETTAIKSK
jgi:hypothetical protein